MAVGVVLQKAGEFRSESTHFVHGWERAASDDVQRVFCVRISGKILQLVCCEWLAFVVGERCQGCGELPDSLAQRHSVRVLAFDIHVHLTRLVFSDDFEEMGVPVCLEGGVE